jgi:hypothetical protein
MSPEINFWVITIPFPKSGAQQINLAMPNRILCKPVQLLYRAQQNVLSGSF